MNVFHSDRNQKRLIAGLLLPVLLMGLLLTPFSMSGVVVWTEAAEANAPAPSTEPKPVADSGAAARVDMTGGGAAVTPEGKLFCWGDNASGRVGDGTLTPRNVPTYIMDGVSSVVSGINFTAAIKNDGSLYMWGDNTYGQLGNGTQTGSTYPVKVLEKVASVSIGNECVAAITSDGILYAWGRNHVGQLGDGTIITRRSPVKIMDNVASVKITSGDVTAAIGTDGMLYVWGGYNSMTYLGNGKSVGSQTPVKIMENVSDVCFGDNFGAALLTDGTVYAWGDNTHGQLGNGSTESSTSPVKAFEEATAVTASESSMAAIRNDGSLYVWGQNTYHSGLSDQLIPVKIDNNVKSVSFDHVCSYIKTDDSLYLWHGYLSYIGVTEESGPKKIFSDVASFSDGKESYALITIKGELYTWGQNSYCQLGDGRNEDRTVPNKIYLLENQKPYDNGEVTWNFSEDVLTLSATEGTSGSMISYGKNGNAPWLSDPRIMDVKTVIVDDSITSLGRYMLVNLNLDALKIGGGVQTVPKDLVYGGSISEVSFAGGVLRVEEYAFTQVEILVLYMPKSMESFPSKAVYCEFGDAIGQHVTDVYGYRGTVSEEYVTIINRIPRDRKTEEWGYYIAPEITFHQVSLKTKITDQRTIRENVQLLSAATSEGEGDCTLVLSDADDTVLRDLLYMSVNSILQAFEMTLLDAEGNEATDFGYCEITMPIPALMNNDRGTVEVYCVSDYGTLERLETETVTVDEVPCLKFKATHFSQYGMFYSPKEEDPEGGGSSSEGGSGSGGGSGSEGSSGGSGSGQQGESSGKLEPDTEETDATEYLYRMYNPNNGEHFYTQNIYEKDTLEKAGWDYEGIAWTAPTGGVAVYRLYNPNTGDHHYTTDDNERSVLVNVGWRYEGVGWRSTKKKSVPVYRLYNPYCRGAGSHHYTMDAKERDLLTSYGWNAEGTGWYGV